MPQESEEGPFLCNFLLDLQKKVENSFRQCKKEPTEKISITLLKQQLPTGNIRILRMDLDLVNDPVTIHYERSPGSTPRLTDKDGYVKKEFAMGSNGLFQPTRGLKRGIQKTA